MVFFQPFKVLVALGLFLTTMIISNGWSYQNYITLTKDVYTMQIAPGKMPYNLSASHLQTSSMEPDSCSRVSKLIYIKTRKTGSSTMTNILYRYSIWYIKAGIYVYLYCPFKRLWLQESCGSDSSLDLTLETMRGKEGTYQYYILQCVNQVFSIFLPKMFIFNFMATFQSKKKKL